MNGLVNLVQVGQVNAPMNCDEHSDFWLVCTYKCHLSSNAEIGRYFCVTLDTGQDVEMQW